MREDTVRRLSTGELIRHLVNNISGLIDREVELAKEESRSNALHIGVGVAALAIGALLLFCAIPAFIVAIIYAIGPGLAPWAAALIAAGVFIVLGCILAFIGFSIAKLNPLVLTRATLKEDIEWAKGQTRLRGK